MFLELAYALILIRTLYLDVRTLNFAIVYHVLPNSRLFERLLVTHHHQEVLGSSDCHIQSTFVKQET